MTTLFNEIIYLRTEQRNPVSENIDIASINEILHIINDEDKKVAFAVEKEILFIEEAVKNIVERIKKGGRLLYFGAGTSGRLGIVDASECPPTFGSPPELVQGFIAGGRNAMFKAVEGAEDLVENGFFECKYANVSANDVVCCIAASGRTPYIKGVLLETNRIGAFTVLITTISREELKKFDLKADVFICPDVGAEVIAGSTRMKSGTAQKLVLNMLTTASMIRLGKTYGNVMIDLQLTNNKLKERAKNIVMTITGVGYDEAELFLNKAEGNVKTALVMILCNVGFDDAKQLLEKSNGFVKTAIEMAKND
ncbi:MAG TPA: N-acetylmuramic acid 6-phosphate etherase [Candidatus Kapabacteria bacterium]|nr:N-acetylmuramic acid 6-phosphate etherase [Candidatus Kapabacteria bacterium]HPO62428.1 N-acetylmuramic acid 6-phosphate etherase [Candidatus Kapabacteria bacterium]